MIIYLLLKLYLAFIDIIFIPIIISLTGSENIIHFIYNLLCVFILTLSYIFYLVVKHPAYIAWLCISRPSPIFNFVTDKNFILKSFKAKSLIYSDLLLSYILSKLSNVYQYFEKFSL